MIYRSFWYYSLRSNSNDSQLGGDADEIEGVQMPDDGRNGGGRFPNRPTDFDVSQFKDFVKQTGEPEHYPKLAHTPPDRTIDDHEVLWDFHVPREARPNGDYIPCSACDGRPKYSYGFLIWSPDGEMRIVGSLLRTQILRRRPLPTDGARRTPKAIRT